MAPAFTWGREFFRITNLVHLSQSVPYPFILRCAVTFGSVKKDHKLLLPLTRNRHKKKEEEFPDIIVNISMTKSFVCMPSHSTD